MIDAKVENTEDALVFAPSYGFRSARIVETPANVVIERDGPTFIAALVSDRDCTTLHFTVTGFPDPPGMAQAKESWQRVTEPVDVRDDRGREISPHPRWATAGTITRRGNGELMLNWELKLAPIARDARSVELSFGGPAGPWQVTIPVRTVESAGIPARSIDVSDVHQGIRVSATALARTHELTAIEIEADPDGTTAEAPRRRHIQGVASNGGSRIAAELLVLSDDGGGQHREIQSLPGALPAPRNRQVLRFPGLPQGVRSGVIEIPFVAVQEPTDESLTLPVPSETDVEFLGLRAHASVSRVSGHDGPRVRVEVPPADPTADTQLLLFNRVEVAGGPPIGGSIAHSPGRPPVMEARDPTGNAPTVILRGPVRDSRVPGGSRSSSSGAIPHSG